MKSCILMSKFIIQFIYHCCFFSFILHRKEITNFNDNASPSAFNLFDKAIDNINIPKSNKRKTIAYS